MGLRTAQFQSQFFALLAKDFQSYKVSNFFDFFPLQIQK